MRWLPVSQGRVRQTETHGNWMGLGVQKEAAGVGGHWWAHLRLETLHVRQALAAARGQAQPDGACHCKMTHSTELIDCVSEIGLHRLNHGYKNAIFEHEIMEETYGPLRQFDYILLGQRI